MPGDFIIPGRTIAVVGEIGRETRLGTGDRRAGGRRCREPAEFTGGTVKNSEYDVTMTHIDAPLKRTVNTGRAIVSGCRPIVSDGATKLAQ